MFYRFGRFAQKPLHLGEMRIIVRLAILTITALLFSAQGFAREVKVGCTEDGKSCRGTQRYWLSTYEWGAYCDGEEISDHGDGKAISHGNGRDCIGDFKAKYSSLCDGNKDCLSAIGASFEEVNSTRGGMPYRGKVRNGDIIAFEPFAAKYVLTEHPSGDLTCQLNVFARMAFYSDSLFDALPGLVGAPQIGRTGHVSVFSSRFDLSKSPEQVVEQIKNSKCKDASPRVIDQQIFEAQVHSYKGGWTLLDGHEEKMETFIGQPRKASLKARQASPGAICRIVGGAGGYKPTCNWAIQILRADSQESIGCFGPYKDALSALYYTYAKKGVCTLLFEKYPLP